MYPKSLLHRLSIGFFLFSLFVPVFQTQATLGGTCTPTDANTVCLVGSKIYPCTQGICTGPCTLDSECVSLVATPLGWGGAKCTGSPEIEEPPVIPAVAGVCLELPRLGSRLADTPPADTGEDLLDVVGTLTNWLFAAFVSLAVIFLVLAGLQFVSSGGDAAKVSEARSKLIWAAVGIVVALASKALVPVIRSMIGG